MGFWKKLFSGSKAANSATAKHNVTPTSQHSAPAKPPPPSSAPKSVARRITVAKKGDFSGLRPGTVWVHEGGKITEIPPEIAQDYKRTIHSEEMTNRGQNEFIKLARWSSDIEAVKQLIEEGVDVNRPSKGGMTALMEAAAAGNVDNVKLLIANGADVNAKDNRGRTPLDRTRPSAYDSPSQIAAMEACASILRAAGANK